MGSYMEDIHNLVDLPETPEIELGKKTFPLHESVSLDKIEDYDLPMMASPAYPPQKLNILKGIGMSMSNNPSMNKIVEENSPMP